MGASNFNIVTSAEDEKTARTLVILAILTLVFEMVEGVGERLFAEHTQPYPYVSWEDCVEKTCDGRVSAWSPTVCECFE